MKDSAASRTAALPREEATRERQRQILDAALACFLDGGVAATTIEQIRDRSGASVGSIYHHFGGKGAIAGALYLEFIRDYQEGFAAELRRNRGAREDIEATLRFHLRWVAKHPDWARYLFEVRDGEGIRKGDGLIFEQNRAFMREVLEWVKPHVTSGIIAPAAPDIFYAIWIGPAQEFSRMLLGGRTKTAPERAAGMLAEAAWKALRAHAGRPAAPRRPAAPQRPAARG